MSKRAELSTGEALVGLLEAYGVDTIFGIPGVHNVEMYRALPRSGIRHVLVRHEQGAGFMADGYARATGKPGVCFTITGPGLTNILTPLGQAWSDSSNVLVHLLRPRHRRRAQGRGRLHEMIDQRGAAASVTSLAHARLYAQGRARCGGPRLRQFRQPASAPGLSRNPARPAEGAGGRRLDGARPARDRTAAAGRRSTKAVAKLNGAKRPVILLGGGALHAGTAALAIAENAQGADPHHDGRQGCGARGSSALPRLPHGTSRSAGNCCAKADAILCAGSELSETDFWNDNVVIDKNLIRIDIDADAIARPHTAEIAILGDAKLALEAIAAGRVGAQGAMPRQNCDRRRGRCAAPHADARFSQTIRDALPPETVICSDMTQIAYAANEIFPGLAAAHLAASGGLRHAGLRAARRHRRQVRRGRDGRWR